MRLLDVACGSGRFPAALLAAGLAARTPGLRVEVDLLDPSPFSLAEARGVLAPPFVAAADLEVGIEGFAADGPPYDVAWATHALYAVPPSLLGEGLRRMNGALRAGGLGAVGQATSRSHYLRVYDAYRASHAPEATPYTSAEGVADGLRGLGAGSTCAPSPTRPGPPIRSPPSSSCSAACSTTPSRSSGCARPGPTATRWPSTWPDAGGARPGRSPTRSTS